MVAMELVTRDLCAVAETCGRATTSSPTLRWGPLLAALDAAIPQQYVTAMELIYEGYLVHYREGRVCSLSSRTQQETLLAGDVLYARGLHLIAANGDVASVDVLARLMASCSSLRSNGAPFSDDDALWAYAVGALVALRACASLTSVTRLFDMLDSAMREGHHPAVRTLACAAAADLALRRADVLEAELRGLVSPSVPEPVSFAAPETPLLGAVAQ